MSVALVTGAGRGLGLETCRQLGQRRFRVILTARNEREGQAKAERLATEGIDVEYRPLDVSSPSSILALAKGLIADGVKLDVLVNNAGIALDGFDSEVALKTIETNFLGPLRVTDGLLELALSRRQHRHGREWRWRAFRLSGEPARGIRRSRHESRTPR